MTGAAHRASSRAWSGRLAWLVAIALLAALTLWARTVEGHSEAVQPHQGPATVETVAGSEFARVSLSELGAQRIGLELSRVEPVTHPAGVLAVPYAGLVYGSDGTTWIYAEDGAPLRFRRQVVEVATVVGDRVILAKGPAAGTEVVGVGSAQLYGTEFEVGH